MCVILPRVVLFLKVITKTKTLEAKKAGTYVVSRDRCCPPLFLAAIKHFSKINILQKIELW